MLLLPPCRLLIAIIYAEQYFRCHELAMPPHAATPMRFRAMFTTATSAAFRHSPCRHVDAMPPLPPPLPRLTHPWRCCRCRHCYSAVIVVAAVTPDYAAAIMARTARVMIRAHWRAMLRVMLTLFDAAAER